jgi:PAS domain S-box-containing protein
VTSTKIQAKPIGWIVAAAATTTIFILDLVTPLGIGVPMLYVLPILLTKYIPGWRGTVFLSGGIFLLTWVRLVLFFDYVTPQVAGNRVMASFLLLVVAGLLLKQKHLAQQRARDQAALRESEERFAKAFRTSPNPIGITEVATGRCVEVNEACLQLFGFCREEVIGNTTLMLGIWPNHEDRARRIERLKAGEPVRNLERSFKTKSGEVRHILVSSDLAELGGTLCLITVGNDITERKQAEEALRRTESYYRTIFQEAGVGVAQVDSRTGQFLKVNRKYCELVGLTEDEMLATTFMRLTHPDDLAEDLGYVERLRSGELSSFTMEKRYMKKDGSIVWVILNVASLWQAGEMPSQHIAVIYDITARKQMETALRESEERLLLALESANMGTWKWDAERDVLLWNQRQFALFGVRPDDFHGRGDDALARIHPEDRPRIDAAVHRVLEDGVTVGEEFRVVHVDGSVRWLFGSGRPVQDERGRCRHVVGVCLDITERRRTQEEIQSLNEFLEARVRERTAALAEANERWDWVVRATTDGVWDWDLARDTAYFSPRWKEMHGFQEHDSLESTNDWRMRIHPEDRQSVLASLEAYLRGEKKVFWEEYRIQRNDGAYIWVLDRGIAIFNEQGRAVRMVGAETDITWRKEAEHILRRREHEFHTLAENVPALFSYIDRDRRYRFVNKQYEELFCRPDEELIGLSAEDLLGPDGNAQVRLHLEKALAGKVVAFECELKLAGDGLHYLAGQYVPDRDEQGQVAGVFALMTDVTALKATEALLREREAQLRDLGAKLLRTQEEERRRISRDLHDDVMQRMGGLTLDLYGLADSVPSQDAEFLQTQIKACGASAEQLTTDLQRMAHQLHPSILEFGGLEAAVREHVNDFAVRTGVSAEFVTRNVPKDVPLDQATCLYRVLQEGLQNVQKHAEATTVLVRLLRTGRGLGLCIHDDGRGIEPVEGDARRRGLGLTSMAERVGMLNGVFHILTKPDDGTEVHAWVPLEDVKRET